MELTETVIRLQRHNDSHRSAGMRIAPEMQKTRQATGHERLAMRLLTQALIDVKGPRLDTAAFAYGWLIGVPSEVTVIEACDALDIDHGRVLEMTLELPNLEALRTRLIELLRELCPN